MVAIGTFLSFLGAANNPVDIVKTDSYLANALKMENANDRKTLSSISRRYVITSTRIQVLAVNNVGNDNNLKPLVNEKGSLLKGLVKDLKNDLSEQGWRTLGLHSA